MKSVSVYERAYLTITEFDTDDAIVTSGLTPAEPTTPPTLTKRELENSYGNFGDFSKSPVGGWF